MKRIYWIDILKAVGIILVLIGHTNGISKFFEAYIFSFHMPLFFFVSGLLIREGELRKEFSFFLQKHFTTLLIPYFFFNIVSYVPWVLFTRHLGADAVLNINPAKPLVGMFYGIGVDGWLQHNAMLWFFPCLFVIHTIFYWVAKLESKYWLIFVAVMSGAAGYLVSISQIPRLPWGADIALSGMVFYVLGFILKDIIQNIRLGWMSTFVIAFLFLGMQITAISINGRVDMNFLSFGNPVLFYLGGISGVAFWVLICKRMPKFNWLARIGIETVVIFPLHRVAFSFITGVAVFVLRLQGDFKSYFVTSILYMTLTIVLLLPIAKVLRKNFPWAIGQKKAMLHA